MARSERVGILTRCFLLPTQEGPGSPESMGSDIGSPDGGSPIRPPEKVKQGGWGDDGGGPKGGRRRAGNEPVSGEMVDEYVPCPFPYPVRVLFPPLLPPPFILSAWWACSAS